MLPENAWVARARRFDAAARAWPRWAQLLAVLLTLCVMAWQSLPHVPRPFTDFRQSSWLSGISQPDTFGTDTIADTFEARVVRHDVWDMYTKAGVDQTPEEAATWSKAASAPYPPLVLLCQAALAAIGDRLGIGLYGMTLGLAVLFVLLSAAYCLRTRWYLFPLLYLNFVYFSGRFVEVQDGTYLVMLVTIMAALFAARAGSALAHALVAAAAAMKLLPLYYVRHLGRLPRLHAAIVVAILAAGLVLPAALWPNYTYIFTFHEELKGGTGGLVAGAVFGALFAVCLAYVDSRGDFDLEDRIGWSLVPVALFLAMKMNVPRHLLVVLLVPDKRVWRNAAAAIALLVPLVVPGARFGAALPVATVLLFAALAWELSRIGWDTVRDDWRHPARTLRGMVTGRWPGVTPATTA